VSEIAKVFKGLPKRFNKAGVKTARTYYFSLGDDEKWTVHIAQGQVHRRGGQERGRRLLLQGVARALPRRLERQAPARRDGLPDRRVKSNNPMLLKEFVAAFERSK
jgi:hypothetical protein